MKYFILIRDTKEICKLSYFDTRLGIVNNWASPSTPGWNAIDDFALNSVFSNIFSQFGANAPQAGNSASQLTDNLSSNPFSFGNLTSSSWSFPQMDWSSPQSSGGNWFSNMFSSLGSWGVQGGSNLGPANIPSNFSQNNIGKIKQLDPEMQKATVEFIQRARDKGINVEINEGYCPAEVRAKRYNDAVAEGKGREVRYAKPGKSQHIFGKAIDISTRNLSQSQLDELKKIWRDDMGFTYGMDFSAYRENWHFDMRPDIRHNKGMASTWLGNGGQSSYASSGYSSPWGGYDFSFPSFSSSMGGFGSSFGSDFGGNWGSSWINSMFGGSMNFGGWNSGGSSTRALPSQYSGIVQKYADQYGSDAKLISSMMKTESGGNRYAVSSAGAKGVMQIIPAHYKRLGITDPTDPEQNIRGGVILMNEFLNKYHGDKRTALAAYNWGPGNVDKLVRQYGTDNYDVIGPYVYSGTQAYVRQIMNRYNSPSTVI